MKYFYDFHEVNAMGQNQNKEKKNNNLDNFRINHSESVTEVLRVQSLNFVLVALNLNCWFQSLLSAFERLSRVDFSCLSQAGHG